MKFISLFFAFLMTSSLAWANQNNFILANPPGSSSDIVARAVAKAYAEISGNQLNLDYVPGGDHIPAAVKFKNEQRPTVLLGSTTMHIFNYATKDQLPYSDADFEHVAWIGFSHYIYYVRPDSPHKSMTDVLKSNAAIKVGLTGTADLVNVLSIKKTHGSKTGLETVKYKGSPQVLVDVLGGHIDLGVGSISTLLIEQAKAGKIKIIGITHDADTEIAGQSVPSTEKELSSKQFNGGFLISVKPGTANTAEGRQMIEYLRRSVQHEHVRSALESINIRLDGRDGAATLQLIQSYRQSAIDLLRSQ